MVSLCLKPLPLSGLIQQTTLGVVGLGKGIVYLSSLGCPTDIGLQLGKACYPCSR